MECIKSRKVTAIKDVPSIGFNFRGKIFDKAYSKGDIFEVSVRDREHHTREEVIIDHPLIGDVMICKRSNFMSLEEFRQIKLEQLEI